MLINIICLGLLFLLIRNEYIAEKREHKNKLGMGYTNYLKASKYMRGDKKKLTWQEILKNSKN